MTLMIRRRFVAAGVATVLAGGGSAARAQAVAGKPVRLVVPYGVGGGADFSARLIAQKLIDGAGIKAIVDNKPGASGIVGTDFVAKAPADGSVLLYCDTTHALNTAVNPKVPYDPVKDFKPMTLIGQSPQLLVAHPSFPANSLSELLALPRDKTKDMAIGSSGLGSTPHMTYERLHLKTGLTLVHVPYKGGGPALNDVVTGQIPLVVNSIPACIPHLQAKRLKALAIASAERNPRMPEVQTFAEAGAPGIEVSTWYGVLAPVRTPQEIVDPLSREIERTLGDAEVKARFAEAFLDPMPRGEKAFATFLAEEMQQWKAVATQTGVVVD
jgi:tripartite-type tricarboxylate transporter receptor subunit TctC